MEKLVEHLPDRYNTDGAACRLVCAPVLLPIVKAHLKNYVGPGQDALLFPAAADRDADMAPRVPAPGQDRDPGELERVLDRCRRHYNAVRLHEGIGYVTPEDEHHGRGKAIRAARRAGLGAAREQRLATNRELRKDHP